MRAASIALVLIPLACSQRTPRLTGARTAPWLTQEQALLQSVCLAEPDETGCAELRAEGLLPPEPPPLDRMLRCWAVDEPRDGVETSICLGTSELAIDGARGWNVWPHTGWRRDDTVTRAGWSTAIADGRTLWLTVVEDERTELYISDGAGLAARLVSAGATRRAEVAAERAALPAVDEVCAAARACLAAMPREPVVRDPESEIEMEIEPPPEPHALDGAVTLRDCDAGWKRAADALSATGAAVPEDCAHDVDQTWWRDLRPPYRPLEP